MRKKQEADNAQQPVATQLYPVNKFAWPRRRTILEQQNYKKITFFLTLELQEDALETGQS